MSGGARWPDCATGWHERCHRPDRCGCPCHQRPAPSSTSPARDGGRDEAREAVARWLSAAVDGPAFWDNSSGWDDANRYQSGYRQDADELLALPALAALLRDGEQR